MQCFHTLEPKINATNSTYLLPLPTDNDNSKVVCDKVADNSKVESIRIELSVHLYKKQRTLLQLNILNE